jgi:hypothetical protein
MLTSDGRVVLIDFGLMKQVEPGDWLDATGCRYYLVVELAGLVGSWCYLILSAVRVFSSSQKNLSSDFSNNSTIPKRDGSLQLISTQ